jgi:hypothetical protein
MQQRNDLEFGKTKRDNYNRKNEWRKYEKNDSIFDAYHEHVRLRS